MDRTAWIVIALCILGLVLWEVYSFRQVQPRPVTAAGPSAIASPAAAASTSPAPTLSSPGITAAAPSPAASAQPSPSATPQFAEVTDTLRNADMELHLTNRGGGIAKAVLLNHLGEQDRRVTLNSGEHPPI